MTERGTEDVRAVSAAIGRNYDSVVYELQAVESIGPAPVLGLAALDDCAGILAPMSMSSISDPVQAPSWPTPRALAIGTGQLARPRVLRG
jgi:hypothetical protein